MGNIDEISKAIGRIEGKLENMEETALEFRNFIRRLSDEGCARGKSNTHRLDGLEQEHRTAGAISGGIAGVLAGIGAKLLDFIGK